MTTSTDTAINDNFDHRLEGKNDGSRLFFYESIKASLERAAAIADILGSVQDANEIKNIWRVSQAIEFEIKDAKLLLEKFFTQQSKEEQPEPESTNKKH